MVRRKKIQHGKKMKLIWAKKENGTNQAQIINHGITVKEKQKKERKHIWQKNFNL